MSKLRTGVGKKAPEELTDLELFEYARKRLGIGDWTPSSGKPYAKWAGLEGYKLKLAMGKRHASKTDFVLCVDYCARHHIFPEHVIWVFQNLRQAKDEARLAASQLGLPTEIDDAIAYEQALASTDSPSWVRRLMRAQGPFREEVLAEWRSVRASQLTN